MATFKCPDCGATLTDDSRFCKYCGAKIDDGVKRIEVKIDKRVEDVADVRRVSYEERESDLRVKQMQQQLKAKKAKRIMMLSVFIVCAVFAAISFGFHMENALILPTLIATTVGPVFLILIVVQLIQGKW